MSDAVVDRIRSEKRVAGKVHLRDQTGRERGTEQGEMNVGRTPCVVVIAPGVATGPDRDEAVMAIGVGQGVTTTGEVGIEWRIVLIDSVQISSSGVGLPDFHQRVCHGPRIFVECPQSRLS